MKFLQSKALLPAVLALAVLLRVGVALALGSKVEALPGIADQISYHTLALRLLGGHGFTFPKFWWPLTQPDTPTAFWSYLYTGFLAGVYAVFGPQPLAARLVQAGASGLLTPWLAYRVGRRTFGAGPGLIAAVWVGVYGYFIYYSAALMTETFYILGILWTFDIAQRLAAPASSGRLERYLTWGELGLALGLTAYFRQVFLLFTPFLFLWLAGARLWRRSAPAHAAATGWGGWVRGAVVGGGVAAALILPATLYNYRTFGRPVLLNTNAGYALFWANHPIYGDRFVPILTPDMPTYRDLIPAELRNLDEAALDSALLGRAVEFIAADPGRYARLSLSRVPIYFQFWPAAESSTLSNIVRTASFGLALPFMLLGVGLWAAGALRGHASAWPGGLLLLFVVIYSAIHLLSWALIRYRLPVDAALLVFAGRGLAAVGRAALGRRAARLPAS